MTPRRFGTMLKALRQKKGLTQIELAHKADMAQSYLARLERGVRTNPSLDQLRRLAKALGVPVEKLLQ